MGYQKAASGHKAHHPLLVGIFSVLIVLVTTDIYLSILSPKSCSLFSKASQGIVWGNAKNSEQHVIDNEQHQLSESMTINKLLGIQYQDGQTGIVFNEVKALEDIEDSGDAAWERLLTPDGGHLFLTSNETASPREPWGVAMFHGLHCLQMLRDTIQGLERQLNQSNSEEQHDDHQQQQHGNSHGGAGHLNSKHYKHCFAYIAQSIACAADGTLEPPHFQYYKNGTFRSYNIDGADTWHQCRDSSFLWQKVLESEKSPFEHWDHQVGETVQSVWGGNEN